jgi:hypothetical protein
VVLYTTIFPVHRLTTPPEPPLSVHIILPNFGILKLVQMAPFLNFLGKRSAGLSSGEAETQPDTRLSDDSRRSTPLSFRKSQETETPEYKLSGMSSSSNSKDPF